MEPSAAVNDSRGWILCCASGVACVAGALFIYVDSLVRLFPGHRNFRIEQSNVFLACAMSLSFGVMIFSALYNLLPESKEYLKKEDPPYSDSMIGFITMGCFLGGFVGIQVVSRLLHQLMPSHIVDCDHSHSHSHDKPTDGDHDEHEHGSRRLSRMSTVSHGIARRRSSKGPTAGHASRLSSLQTQNGAATESTPLLSTEVGETGGLQTLQQEPNARRSASRESASQYHDLSHGHHEGHAHDQAQGDKNGGIVFAPPTRRKSMQVVRDRVVSFVKDTKPDCDRTGNCFGYTDPCGQECFKHMNTPSALSRATSTSGRFSIVTSIFPRPSNFLGVAKTDEEDQGSYSPGHCLSRAQSQDVPTAPEDHGHDNHTHQHEHDHPLHAHFGHDHDDDLLEVRSYAGTEEDLEAQHHHHVPENPFFSIGMQTVVAIALHKFPEGFITYATNAVDTTLGFDVFMALFVHNIAEGFSLALPLYMTLNSKWKAMAWSVILGGFTQPLGACFAWLYFRLADHGSHPSNLVYAAIFAVTAGIMTSVALQLFVESLTLNHNRNLSITFAFIGMILLGVSGAIMHE